jgi:hypothetical protein
LFPSLLALLLYSSICINTISLPLFSVSKVMQSSGIKGNIMTRDLEEKFELLLDANDTLLERVVSF